ncbi:DNA-binding HxlR family transcriptional regulator [Rhodococcus sp. 27YEA15]
MQNKTAISTAEHGERTAEPGYCPARELFEVLSSKWVIRTLLLLDDAPAVRYSALRRQLPGISHKMMAQTLRILQRDGFVSRHAMPGIPPRVEYSLEPMGHEVLAIVSSFKTWTEENVERVLDHRRCSSEAISDNSEGALSSSAVL